MTDPPGDDAAELARQYERVALVWSTAVTGMVGPEVASHGLEPIVAPTLVHLDEAAAGAVAGEILRVAA